MEGMGTGAKAMPVGHCGPPKRAKAYVGIPLGLTGVALIFRNESQGARCWRRETEAHLFMHLNVQSIRHLVVLWVERRCVMDQRGVAFWLA